MLITVLLLQGAKESVRANNIMVVIQAARARAVHRRRRDAPAPGQLRPFAPNGLKGIPPGRGDRVLRLHRLRRDLDGRRGDEEPAEETCRSESWAVLAICTVIYVVVGFVPDRDGALQGARGRGSRWRRRLQLARVFNAVGWIVALGAGGVDVAVLLVFQYGQPRIFYAWRRDGLLPQWAAKLRRGR
jgi:APA family basic amino acid/polyamine antiporter